MAAKVSKSRTKMKNQPHIKTMTKTILKKQKNKGGLSAKAIKTTKKKLKNEKKGLGKMVGNKKIVKKILKKKKMKKEGIIRTDKDEIDFVTGLDKEQEELLKKRSYDKAAPLSLLLDTSGNVGSEDGGGDELEDAAVAVKDEAITDDSSGAEISDAEEENMEELLPEKTQNREKKRNGKTPNKSPVKRGNKHAAADKNTKKGTENEDNSTEAKKNKKKKKNKKAKKRNGRSKDDYETLKAKERELVLDLFGTDAGIFRAEIEPRESIFVAASTDKVAKEETDGKRKKADSEDDGDEVDDVVAVEPKRKAAWVDDDDDNIRVKDVVANMAKARGTRGERETSTKKYQAELHEKFNQVYGGTPDWADLDSKPQGGDDGEDDDDDELIRRTGNYLSKNSSATLPKRSLEYKMMVDLNSSHTEGSRIEAIDFNPNLLVALVAGCIKNNSAVTIYQVDGKTNHRVHSSRFPGYSLTCAKFLADGRKFVLGSNTDCHFYSYDMETSAETRILWKKKTDRIVKEHLYVSPDGKLLVLLGHSGKVCLYDTATLSLVDILQAPHVAVSAAFNADGSRMYTHGNTGEVCIWDMHARECVHKFFDDGCISGGIVATAPNDQFLACGSTSGVVNIYDTAGLSSSVDPKPVKSLYNLTTKVTSLHFNASSEILAMASDCLQDALKLIHFPSMTVFENFPMIGRAVKPVQCLQFSPQSGYFAIGNRFGAAQLFRLKHFASY